MLHLVFPAQSRLSRYSINGFINVCTFLYHPILYIKGEIVWKLASGIWKSMRWMWALCGRQCWNMLWFQNWMTQMLCHTEKHIIASEAVSSPGYFDMRFIGDKAGFRHWFSTSVPFDSQGLDSIWFPIRFSIDSMRDISVAIQYFALTWKKLYEGSSNLVH